MTIDECKSWRKDPFNRDSLQSGMCIDFLLSEVARLETALWSHDEGLLERDKKVELATAKVCIDEALQFTKEGYHPEKRGTAAQIVACIQVRFNI